MNLEHVAINVPDPAAMSDWYVEHCGLKEVIRLEEPPYTRFLTDDQRRTAIEIYHNPAAPVPDYKTQNHLVYHNAFTTDNIEATRDKLTEAGASFVEDINLPNGTRLVMLRDPWGVPLQLVNRVNPWY
jgi:catechol 2,3-dioxygenase-like lactoylglutathione lyase family enzyme